ncbi:hypothetical protein JL100_015495 [Skermanella mucosa]|uniref:NnrU family protein n=1 Tax=Skermanella mucosa TaxID=1789672 RepID=UPI00192A8B0D|nr:NnrU family protein [Skermanella mucosa]UEM18521.1 hypothetical protein JL100_015495 [Skermanella mucosa]
MELLILSTLLLIGSHVVPGLPGVRSSLVAALGRTAFLTAYSAVSLATLALLVRSYAAADMGAWLYVPPAEARVFTVVAMPVALFLLVGRLTTPARTADPAGIYRITAVPGSLGVLLWTLLHLASLGEARQVVVFAGMAAIALFSLARNWHAAGPARRRAGILPFAGILLGRERLEWGEIGWARPLLAIVLWAALLLLHPVVIGPDPLAYL